MTKRCPYCGEVFEANHGLTRYCSRECAGMARRRPKPLPRKATLDMIENVNPVRTLWINAPKSYAEIRRENRQRKVKTGWRGQPVPGGGSIRRHDPWLVPSEV